MDAKLRWLTEPFAGTCITCCEKVQALAPHPVWVSDGRPNWQFCEVGLLKHFLSALRLKQQNQPGEKARSLNMMLKKSGVEGTLANVRLGLKCGRKAQVAERAIRRDVCNML